ncbi:MAG: hypothetical protein U0Z17_01405 [Bacteroidales bacterium]
MLVLTIVAVFVIEFKRIKLKESDTIPNTGEVESAKKHYTWDVFLAAPWQPFPMKVLKATC